MENTPHVTASSSQTPFWIKPLLLVAGVAVLSAAGYSFYVYQKESKSKLASDSFYEAEKLLESEMVPFAKEEGFETKKIDVSATFSKSIPAFNSVAEKFSGTRAAFEAKLEVAKLYRDHGDVARAVSFYEEALKLAPNSFTKAVVFTLVGKANLDLSKFKEAETSFKQGLSLGDTELKPELMLGQARALVQLKDVTSAKAILDKIGADFPTTSVAKTAESLKEELAQ